jgi:hypothetical protein
MNKHIAENDEAKRDVTGLFQLYGAIDKYMELRPRTEEPPSVASLLPVYRKLPEALWYTSYLKVSGDDPGFGVNAYDPVALVLAALAFLAERRPKGQMRARRLYAAAAAGIAFRDVDGVTDEAIVAAALGEEAVKEFSPADVKQLTALLRRGPAGTSPAAREEWWKEAVVASGQDPEDVGPVPSACVVETTLMDVNGDMDPVPTFKTVFDVPLSFDDAREFFDPMKWICFPSWCAMKDGGRKNGVHQYRETVSFACGNKKVLALVVNLDFVERPIEPGPPRIAITVYKLSENQPTPCYVLVNEGRLEIRELRDEPDPLVRITTTKSIKFVEELDSLGLASFLCLAGYAGMVEDLVSCATKKAEEADGGYQDIGFRGVTRVEDNEERNVPLS